MEQLVGLGVSWVWMGLEGKQSQYAKLKNVDTSALVKTLQSHGIRVLGSSILGLEDHRPEHMDRIIDEAVSYATDFHQFMLYTPNPGTPLYARHKADGTLLDESEFSPADAHGQYRFNYRHNHIPAGMEEHFLRQAFETDFAVNGPSLARMIRTQLTGWLKYHSDPDTRIRKRCRQEAEPLATTYAGAVWAMRQWYASDTPMAARMDRLLKDLYHAFGVKTRLIAPVYGRVLQMTMKREQRRLASGWTYEPKTCYQKNPAALALESATAGTLKPTAAGTAWVIGKTSPAN